MSRRSGASVGGQSQAKCHQDSIPYNSCNHNTCKMRLGVRTFRLASTHKLSQARKSCLHQMLWMHVENGRSLLHSARLAGNLHNRCSSEPRCEADKAHHTMTHRKHESIEGRVVPPPIFTRQLQLRHSPAAQTEYEGLSELLSVRDLLGKHATASTYEVRVQLPLQAG